LSTLVIVFIWRQQAGYTKVLTAKVARQELATVVSGTGQIKPRTYANLSATAMGRVTRLYVKEGDLVKKGQIVATIENVQQKASVAGQQAAIAAAKTDIASYVAAEKTAEANVEKAKADLEQKRLDWEREQPLYKAGIVAKSDYDVKKAAYDTDVASLNQSVAALNQAKAQTDSYRAAFANQHRHVCAPTRICSTRPSWLRHSTPSSPTSLSARVSRWSPGSRTQRAPR
jgi:HlyD family secretion protein